MRCVRVITSDMMFGIESYMACYEYTGLLLKVCHVAIPVLEYVHVCTRVPVHVYVHGTTWAGRISQFRTELGSGVGIRLGPRCSSSAWRRSLSSPHLIGHLTFATSRYMGHRDNIEFKSSDTAYEDDVFLFTDARHACGHNLAVIGDRRRVAKWSPAQEVWSP